ncbi:PREDICTED: uncharacterized protein LOC108762224 [Trachymyrmex cornetzi]|uniref:uncharacterized protein LOC108762224 n=1 Tax=Trachymyrmex cornetzi TaxID=471704 RepID=UPI00084F27D7|nr:PREDICTED: uncharacterized protein LOC108762224 [Trachymyrmex cornetzi]
MSNFTVKELKQQLRSRNLPVTGLKADLINRLQTNSSYQSYTNSSYTRGSKESELKDSTVYELKTQLKAKDLPVTGTKADLINRLQADTPYQSYTNFGIKADLIKRLQIHTPYQSHVQTMDTERNRITSYEKPTMDGKWFTHTKTVVHAADLTNVATKTYSNLNKIRFEDTKTADAAKVTNATARNSMDRNLIRFEDTKMTASVTEGTNTTAEDKTVASTEETRTLVNMNMFQFGDTKTTADAAEATNAAAKSSTNINVNRFEDTKTAAGVTEVTNTTAEAKAVANAIEETNAAARNYIDDNIFRFGKAKTIAGVTEEINPTRYFDVHMIWKKIELYRREKELAEQALMLARNEIEMLRYALIDTHKKYVAVSKRYHLMMTTVNLSQITIVSRISMRNSTDVNIRLVKTVVSVTEVKNAATKLSVEDNSTKGRSLFEYSRQLAKARRSVARYCTKMNIQFRDTKTTAEDKTVASTTEAMNGETKTSVNMNMFQFGDTKTPAGAAEVTNAAAKSSTNINVFRFEDTKTAADTIETTNTTAEAKAVANATKETNAAVRNFVGDISKGYVGTFQFGKAKIVASAAEATNATRNFTDVNINRFEGTKMAAGVTEEINPKYFVDVHMIWREAELYRREKELAEQELMLARKEIEMLRQALIDMATRPQKICCCFERMSLKDENGESVSVSRQDKCNCKLRPEHKDRRH